MSASAGVPLTGTIAAAISDEEVLQPNRLAWVTRHYLIIRNSDRQSHTIIPLQRLAGIDVVKTPYSGLLAIAAGVFILAAAAFASKQGGGAAVPCALLGAFFVAVYFGSRRATITFTLDSGAKEITAGPLGDAAALIRLIDFARSAARSGEGGGEFSSRASVSASNKKSPKTSGPVLESSSWV